MDNLGSRPPHMSFWKRYHCSCFCKGTISKFVKWFCFRNTGSDFDSVCTDIYIYIHMHIYIYIYSWSNLRTNPCIWNHWEADRIWANFNLESSVGYPIGICPIPYDHILIETVDVLIDQVFLFLRKFMVDCFSIYSRTIIGSRGSLHAAQEELCPTVLQADATWVSPRIGDPDRLMGI